MSISDEQVQQVSALFARHMMDGAIAAFGDTTATDSAMAQIGEAMRVQAGTAMQAALTEAKAAMNAGDYELAGEIVRFSLVRAGHQIAQRVLADMTIPTDQLLN